MEQSFGKMGLILASSHVYSRHPFYLHLNTIALTFIIIGPCRDCCNNLLNVLTEYRFAFILPFPLWLYHLQRDFCEMQMWSCCSSLKALSVTRPGVSPRPFCYGLIFCPFNHSLSCSYTNSQMCEAPLLSVPFHMLPAMSGMHPLILLCSSSSKKCLRLSQTTFCLISLCYHIAPFMRSVS